MAEAGAVKDGYAIGSLFSGIGGIELGFESQGFRTAWFVENEPYAQTILKKRFPSAKIYGDITEIDFTAVPQIDMLTGGFPCQDISNAGKRTGIEGSRSSLWKYYFKAIGILRPKIAFIENVSAILGRGLDVVLADLAQVGYDAEWYCVPASAVGANHQRDRVFIIAYCNPRFGNQQEKELQAGGNSSDSGSLIPHPSVIGLAEKENEQVMEREGGSQFQPGEPRNNGDVPNANSKPKGYIYNGTGKNIGTTEKEDENVPDTKSIGFNRRICSNRKEPKRIHEHKQIRSEERSKASGCNKIRGETEERKAIPDSDIREQSYGRNNAGMGGKSVLDKEAQRTGYWATEPRLGRVADGVPNRVHRIKCLGNAVVPQVAEVFAKAIKEIIFTD